MANRFIFLIRGKLGDSLVAYSVFREFLVRHPDDDVILMVKRNYLPLLEGERGFSLVPYKNRTQAALFMLMQRLLGRRISAFTVLWGSGDNLKTLAKFSGAKRRIFLDDRYSDVFTEFPLPYRHERQVDEAWQTACVLDKALPRPEKLLLPSLAARRVNPRAIGICPLSDEIRRNMDSEALRDLLKTLAVKFPDAPLYVFVNPGEEAVVPSDAPARTEIKLFATLPQLVDFYANLMEWYGTDTGLYHLAAAMDIPCTLFSGPTLPNKNIMPMQDTVGYRLAPLGNSHCEIKSCRYAACLIQAVHNFTGENGCAEIARTPAGCPLRSVTDRQLLENFRYETACH